jgi:hypothetical protein
MVLAFLSYVGQVLADGRPSIRGPTSAACRTNDGTIICARSVVHIPWSDAIPLCGHGRSSSERPKTALDKPDL